mmetsp:Transcript_14813/g.21832  ORF Transcript_14813/g.21832 Transcript_14813/m.21832 type:complete len:306 (-) Transcript_14813:303-1220(-)
MESAAYVRNASHAGSWYTNDCNELNAQLSGWIEEVDEHVAAQIDENGGAVRAIIGPHAGYSYSGPTAAWAYAAMRRERANIKRVFVLGPSHHVYTAKCGVSLAAGCATPLHRQPLEIDQDLTQDLLKTGLFEVLTANVDEDEHSLEMHLPYIAKVMEGQVFKLVCLMVGSTSPEAEARYGEVLAPFLGDPSNFFVVSSDFCHWGSRFRYTPYDSKMGSRFQYIEWLDHQGMQLIEAQNVAGFQSYLQQYGNTICGRHPISVLLEAMKSCSASFSVKFLKYAQSSQVKSAHDSSVSYASAVIQEAS